MRVKRTPNCVAGCWHQERKGRPDEADWADYTDRSMRRYGSSWRRDFLGTAAGNGIGMDFPRFNGHFIRPILDRQGGVRDEEKTALRRGVQALSLIHIS